MQTEVESDVLYQLSVPSARRAEESGLLVRFSGGRHASLRRILFSSVMVLAAGAVRAPSTAAQVDIGSSEQSQANLLMC